MDARAILKARMISRRVAGGQVYARHRSCLYVMIKMSRTLAENLEHVRRNDGQDVVRPANSVTGTAIGPGSNIVPGGAIWKYAPTVGNALVAAIAHPGEAKEMHCYAGI